MGLEAFLLLCALHRKRMGVCASSGVDSEILTHTHEINNALDEAAQMGVEGLRANTGLQQEVQDSLRQLGGLIRDINEDRAEASPEALYSVAEALYGRAATE